LDRLEKTIDGIFKAEAEYKSSQVGVVSTQHKHRRAREEEEEDERASQAKMQKITN
jgi:hypothetical protein